MQLDDGSIVTALCPNSGSMKSCMEENAEVYLSIADNPNRKTKYTWEMIKIGNGWVGINTHLPNQLAHDAILAGQIGKLKAYNSIKREVTYGKSRLDLMAENEDGSCFIEVKNVTLKEGTYALFPDSVTSRGTKHLKTLMDIKNQGHRAVMLYIIQRTDVEIFAPAADIDKEYTETLKKACEKGVEIIAVQAVVTPRKIELLKELAYEI